MRGGEIDRSRVGVKYTHSSRPPGGTCVCVCVCVWHLRHHAGPTHRWELKVKRGAITPITSTAQISGAFLKAASHAAITTFTAGDPNYQPESREFTPTTEPRMSSTDRRPRLPLKNGNTIIKRPWWHKTKRLALTWEEISAHLGFFKKGNILELILCFMACFPLCARSLDLFLRLHSRT